MIEPDVPAMDVKVSVAVTVCTPTVFRVSENPPLPFVTDESAGKSARLSVLVKCTIPEYPVAILFQASSANRESPSAVPELI